MGDVCLMCNLCPCLSQLTPYQRDDHPGRGGHHGGGRGGHEGPGRGGGHQGDGSHRQELREDMTDVHHARDELREADTDKERKEAREKLQDAQGELKKDWGPGMPKHAGEGHRGGGGGGGGGRRDDDDDGERKGHGRKDND